MKKEINKVWTIPFLLGVLILFGLLSSLLGTGYWYWLSWTALLIPILVILQKWIKALLNTRDN